MGRENSVVGLDNGGGDTRRRVDGKLQLGLLSIVGGQALEEESTEAGAGTAAEGVEDQESLEGAAVVCCRYKVSFLPLALSRLNML